MNIVINPKELFKDINCYIILHKNNNFFSWDIAKNINDLHYRLKDRNVWPPIEGYNIYKIKAEQEIIFIRNFLNIKNIKEEILKKIEAEEEIFDIKNTNYDDDVFW
jgi:hypothetical protein